MSEQIHHGKTKEYFKEVLESYHNENYRATTVILYSIVICDLVYKLTELAEVFNDDKSIQILKEIESLQNNNPKSADWESELVSLIEKRTSIFRISTFENIQILKKHRHLCAHPVLNSDYLLFSPNRETTRAHIRNMLEDIFTQPPALSKGIFIELIKDIADKKDIFPPRFDNIQFEKYITNKYLNNAPKDTVSYVYRNLWKLAFRIKNQECDKNRDVNYSTLYIIHKKNKNECLKLIKDDKAFYSKIEKGETCYFLISFISIFPEIFNHLEDHAKIQIKEEANRSSHYKIRAWYLDNNLTSHFNNIIEEIKSGSINIFEPQNTHSISTLVRNTSDHSEINIILEYIITLYTESENSDLADHYFSRLIRPNIKFMRLSNIELLLAGIEQNDQTYNRINSKNDHSYLKEVTQSQYGEQINFSKYSNFSKSTQMNKNATPSFDDFPFW